MALYTRSPYRTGRIVREVFAYQDPGIREEMEFGHRSRGGVIMMRNAARVIGMIDSCVSKSARARYTDALRLPSKLLYKRTRTRYCTFHFRHRVTTTRRQRRDQCGWQFQERNPHYILPTVVQCASRATSRHVAEFSV